MSKNLYHLYVLKAKDIKNTDNDPWFPWQDKMFSIVVYARTEEEARTLANQNAQDEIDVLAGGNPRAWLDSEFSTCEFLRGALYDPKHKIVIRNVHSG